MAKRKQERLPVGVLEAVARELDIDPTDVIIMAPERPAIRDALKRELVRQGYW